MQYIGGCLFSFSNIGFYEKNLYVSVLATTQPPLALQWSLPRKSFKKKKKAILHFSLLRSLNPIRGYFIPFFPQCFILFKHQNLYTLTHSYTSIIFHFSPDYTFLVILLSIYCLLYKLIIPHEILVSTMVLLKSAGKKVTCILFL